MESVDIRDDAHPVRWEPAGDSEAGVYITLHEAVIRLVRYWGEDQREWVEQKLQAGDTLRTAFAYYRIER
jgi:hypothetical protein